MSEQPENAPSLDDGPAGESKAARRRRKAREEAEAGENTPEKPTGSQSAAPDAGDSPKNFGHKFWRLGINIGQILTIW